jgi:transposase
MASRKGAAHVVTTKRHYKGRTYTSHLLRRSYRVDGKVKNETLGNLSHLPEPLIDLIRRSLKGETFVPASERFEKVSSFLHGHVQAVRTAMARLSFEQLIGGCRSRERDLVCAMVAARIVAPHTKLATTRWWHTTTLAEDLGVFDATEDDLYAAMDWLLERQDRIEKKLAARHLERGGLVLYDLTSSYFEGTTCPLARLGHNRDRKKGKLQVNYGLTTDPRGCPVAVSVFEGNVTDAATLEGTVTKLREEFGIDRLVLVGDRGMISHKAIEEDLGEIEGLSWITALKSAQIRTLVEGGGLQLGLFDKRNLFEFRHPDYPGERLVACRNTELGRLRAHKRQSLLEATAKELEKVRAMVERGRLRGADAIGLRVGRVVNKYKVAKHFDVEIKDDSFAYVVNKRRVAAEAALDGVYVIRTSLPAAKMTAAQAVRSYKSLANVERAFRSLKTVDLKVRPIHHRLADRVRSHIFLCMLAYYVEWHMREAWRPLLFADEEVERKKRRDPVAPAKRSASADEKALTKKRADGGPAHSFSTLLQELSAIVRNVCTVPGDGDDRPTFQLVTTPNNTQRRALDLLATIQP